MIYIDALTCVADHFNDEYFKIHQLLLEQGQQVASRNGATVELLNFKTVIKNPIKRCIGGYNRNINIFFLLAEAIWIFCSRRDVLFLDTFNSQLKQYSDDDVNYHAPYGWRLRNWGIESVGSIFFPEDSNKHAFQGTDQLLEAIKMLDINSEDRRVVLSVWNPDFDLNKKSNDIPCNDMIMYKIRNGHLYCTIANRSNDLNLGLTTNVFQFSFLSEIMSKILGIGLGDQVHNSQSLHLYLNHPLTGQLSEEIKEQENKLKYALLYEHAKFIEMDFNFASFQGVEEKLKLIDFHVNSIISILMSKKWKNDNLITYMEKGEHNEFGAYIDSLKEFSRYFYFVYKLLDIYVDYKSHKRKGLAVHSLASLALELPEFEQSDYMMLALNFFIARMLSGTDFEQSVVKQLRIEWSRFVWNTAINTGRY
jgi:thymidylate synthase